MQGISFVGMPYSGKSAVGKRVAHLVNWQFIDLDLYIKEREKASVGEINNGNKGGGLVNIEKGYVLAFPSFENRVMAPGGSMVFAEKAMERLKKETTVIYIATPLSILEERAARDNVAMRGIVGMDERGLAGVLLQRQPLYEKYADYTCVWPWKDADDLAARIVADLKLA
ncbi:shikimate kinase [Candidatus Uhrbacteria bacterium CG10_big_fil_rev_8_21_14_0_10_48_11]|uniref:Shikimate kinase n=1 Tax=Candidatus Uhrbacteria bacterium CG10_big_fil_rev_8_21_14_0_10_48_11 TaxID=1975037 RepID=A0A2M8LDL5_9BACT|nr:MAG: shikimate kinase [Candidatus Uhrbacteria bacterium CG10_big_fil_rev_8_21_14_0_10_48_11]